MRRESRTKLSPDEPGRSVRFASTCEVDTVSTRSRLCLAVASLLISASQLASAQTWPTRPVTLVVPFSAGGSTDILARRVANDLSEQLGQQFVVENRGGANGNTGAGLVANAAPDGYTILFATPGPVATNKFLYTNLSFDPDRAFVPIVLIGESPLVIVATPRLPVKTLPELMARASSNPGKVNVGTPGVGSQAHLTMLLLEKLSGTTMTYVPYRGGSNVSSDLLGAGRSKSASITCRASSARSATARCAGSPLRAPSARRNCPMCQQSRNPDSPASNQRPGTR